MLSDARIRFQKGSLFSNKLLGRLCKNQQEIFTWTHFWVLHSTPHTHGHSPDQEHTVVITVSLEWGRPSERVSIPLYSSFSKLFLAILSPMPLHTNYFPALLRYSWHKIMGKFKVYDVMMWWTYMLKMITTMLAIAYVTSHSYWMWRDCEIHSQQLSVLHTWQVRNSVPSAIVTMLCTRAPVAVAIISSFN